MCDKVFFVGVVERAILFNDKNVNSQGQHIVQLAETEAVERKALKGNVAHVGRSLIILCYSEISAKLTQFLNFHTHNFPPPPDEKSIYNLLIQDIKRFGEVENNWISLGIHPWYAHPEDWQIQLAAVEQLAGHKNVLAIGECGLDRGILLPLATQLTIFTAQVKLAEQLQKPVIIHCVRAFNELVQWQKQAKPSVPLVVHGFNNKPEIMQQLLAHDFYFSLGAALLQPESNAVKVLKIIPLSRLFLENDDRSIPIEKIFEAAAVQLEIPISALKNQIWTNFATVFNP
ncbi:hypothetical protein DR864_14030 [Runella rosea]|uniref:TatD DNase family protein n=1 Tax=Runella rosea TaxID=2259595 RepID=A0A344TJG7_9BACT|nr:hypothetical protein DR864_14030 [Runella rosea]